MPPLLDYRFDGAVQYFLKQKHQSEIPQLHIAEHKPNNMRIPLQMIFLLVTVAVISCKPSADITGTWKNPNADAQSMTQELLWSAQSQTYSPDNLSSVAREFSAVLVSKMEKDGVIKPQ
jgi:hypothetical protein